MGQGFVKIVIGYAAGGTTDILARVLAELVALCKSKPGELKFASSRNGAPVHLAGAMFARQAHVNIVQMTKWVGVVKEMNVHID